MTRQLGCMAAEAWLYQNMRRGESALPKRTSFARAGVSKGSFTGFSVQER